MKSCFVTQRCIGRDAIFALLMLSLTLVFSTSCGNRVMSDEESSRWIAAYAPSRIDKDSKIRIELTEQMRSKITDGRDLTDCFDFTPSVKGQAVMSYDKRYIDFVPGKSLKQGRKYTCYVDLRALSGVDSLGDFKFRFFVAQREVQLKNVAAAVDPEDTSKVLISGEMECNAQAGDSLLAENSAIICSAPGATVRVGEKATPNSRRFIISGIERQTKETEVKVSTNPEHGFSKSECKVKVPAVNEFRILNSKRVEAAEPYIDLDFSAPLSSQQEFDGLITIDKVDNLKIERDGCNVKVYYAPNAITDITLRVSGLIKSQTGNRLDEDVELHFKQEVIPPAVEMPMTGSILPDDSNLRLPFRAVNLAAVDVEVVKIFPGNVMAYMQEDNELRRFGTLIYHKTARLDTDKSVDLHRWQNFAIDLKNLFRKERGAIYNVRISFKPSYSLYDKIKPEDFEQVTGITDEDVETWNRQNAYIYRNEYKWYDYNWDDKDDPTKESYFAHFDMPEVNLMASTLGLIVKESAGNEYDAIVTDIMTASPAAGVEIAVYNYQMQKLAHVTSDGQGFAKFKTDSKPFMVTASDGKSTTYLKLSLSDELSTSNFDVSGVTMTDGIKGFTYGDRGVWRPGDDVHLTLIIENKNGSLPENHPVVMELYNPSEQLYARQTLTEGVDGFYVFHVPTAQNVPTGKWEAQFKVGNRTFHQDVRIETIKPNRLKIDVNTPGLIQANAPQEMGLSARWLAGPPAKNMAATIDMELFADPTPFAAYKKYTFKNPLLELKSTQKRILSGQLDSVGHLKKLTTIGTDINAPGMLRANITAKVSEPGGDASISSKSVPFSPFGVYVGIDLEKKDYLTDTDLQIPVVVVNQIGAAMKTRELAYKVYRLDSDWWWEGSAERLDRYVKSSSADLVSSGTVTAVNGAAAVPFRVNYPDWGRYLILVRDTKGGHATGGVITVDWPEWRGRAERGEAGGSTELTFSLDKKSYEAGETANVYLPKCKDAIVLLSIENGARVLKKYRVKTSADRETCFKLPVEESMAPNFYVTATLLCRHSETNQDVPIRLYGVNGASVIDKRTILHPEIEMPDELHPQQTFTVKVREHDNKPMTYTLALVDEGLLDITNYQTPRPWVAMNQREALGVKTWDMYDDVIGAFGSKFRSILSIGGDEAMRKSAGKEKRFNPVVKFLGPFTLKGGTGTHKITMPNYVGSVRVMLVAAHEGSYGNTDKTVKVTSPLMLLTTLPRTLACGDDVALPVNVFAMQQAVRNVTVNVETSGPVSVSGPKTKKLTFDSEDEKLENFRIVCNPSQSGQARIVVTAVSGSLNMTDTAYIDVNNPMPILVNEIDKTIAPGKTMNFTWNPQLTKSAGLQISAMPTINFGGSMTFFENYQHLCTEQLSSKALFMLSGRQFLNPEQKMACEKSLPGVLRSVKSRQLPDGGFVYWPDHKQADSWVTSMAGLVLAEVGRQGFAVDSKSIDEWVGYQEKLARDYKYAEGTDLDQAFRLYALAKAGHPVKAAMNRLLESKKLTQTAAYCLASAYAIDGRSDVAKRLIDRAERTSYAGARNMFASSLRDLAIKMEAYARCKNTAKAMPIARQIARQCSGNNYVTQDIAFATIAMCSLSDLLGNDNVSVRITEKNQKPLSVQNISNMKNVSLAPSAGSVQVANTGRSSAVVSLTTAYQPRVDQKLKPESKGLQISVSYTDIKGMPIAVSNLKQDTEFYARVTITNKGGDVESMALVYAVPSGWEIWNNRLFGGNCKSEDYCDIRDDKICFYTALEAGKKKTLSIRLRAAYAGKFLLPPAVCEDMYNPSCRANTSNAWVYVVK